MAFIDHHTFVQKTTGIEKNPEVLINLICVWVFFPKVKVKMYLVIKDL